PEGDRCDWFAFREADVIDALKPYDPSAKDRADRPFALTHGPSDPQTYALQRVLYTHAAHGTADAVRLEEGAMRVLARALANAFGARSAGTSTAGARRRHAALADAARAEIARRFTTRVSLGDLSRALGTSVFHLCRVFRRETGTTLHAHLDALRVHHA